MNKPIDFDKLMRLGLEEAEASDVHLASVNFSVRGEVIQYTIFTRAVREIARIHRRGVQAKVPEGLLLVAQTGGGKTTLLEYYVGLFPRRLIDGVWSIPVVRVDTPESPSVRTMAEAVLDALGDPMAFSRGSAAEKTKRIAHFCRVCGVQMLMFDEFQHFADGHRKLECKRVTDWLKLLLILLKIPVVIAGLPRSIAVVNSNPQLRRRFGAPHYLEPFSFDDEVGQKEFRGVLAQFGASLPTGSVDISGHEVAQRFYFASHGLIDYVVKVLDDAGSRGGSGVCGAITQEDLAAAFERAVWRGVPPALNPFKPKAALRHLDRRGEPFDIWDDINNYVGVGKRGARHVAV